MKKLIILLPLILLLTGCFNYKEIDDLAIVSAVSFDKKDDKYEVSVQIINTQKQDSSSGTSASSKFYIYKATGHTIQEGIRNVVNTSPRRIYFNHNQLLVISDEIIKDDINIIFDLASRDAESRKDYPIIIAQNTKAYKILETVTTIDNLNAFNIKSSIKTNNEYKGTVSLVSVMDTIKDNLNPNKDISFPSILLKGNKEENDLFENTEESILKSYLKLGTMAIFKDKKFITYLNEKESLGINLLNNKVNHTILTYNCNNDNYISLELINPKTSYKFKDNNLNINIKSKMQLSEIHCNYELTKQKTLTHIEKETNKYLEKIINDTINKVYYEYKSKVIPIEELMYKYKIKNINKINVTTNLELTSIGNTHKEIS